MTGRGDLPLETVIEIVNRHDVPVVVDAAAQLPPVDNLWRFTQMGAALAVFSGGKELRGPQSSGLVLAVADLTEACCANGSPNHSIGRPMEGGQRGTGRLPGRGGTLRQLDHKAKARPTSRPWPSGAQRGTTSPASRRIDRTRMKPASRCRVLVTFDHDALFAHPR
ncbi:MAG: hypothetical protein R2873_22765 [Caldilineaceae bacterium]